MHEVSNLEQSCNTFTPHQYFSGVKLYVEHKKIETMVRWYVPKNMNEVESLLELVACIRKYTKNFNKIATSLKILPKDIFEKNTWTSDYHVSFEALKKDVIKSPSLEDYGSLERPVDLVHGC